MSMVGTMFVDPFLGFLGDPKGLNCVDLRLLGLESAAEVELELELDLPPELDLAPDSEEMDITKIINNGLKNGKKRKL
jgi:hypothetical protein